MQEAAGQLQTELYAIPQFVHPDGRLWTSTKPELLLAGYRLGAEVLVHYLNGTTFQSAIPVMFVNTASYKLVDRSSLREALGGRADYVP